MWLGAASEAVEPGDHQHIASAERGDGLAQLFSVGLGSARHFSEQFPGSGGAESGHLCCDALAVGGDPGIGPDLWRYLMQRKRGVKSRAWFSCKILEF
jgi:hypothetical protein